MPAELARHLDERAGPLAAPARGIEAAFTSDDVVGARRARFEPQPLAHERKPRDEAGTERHHQPKRDAAGRAGARGIFERRIDSRVRAQ
jgi:hypothetical protein